MIEVLLVSFDQRALGLWIDEVARPLTDGDRTRVVALHILWANPTWRRNKNRVEDSLLNGSICELYRDQRRHMKGPLIVELAAVTVGEEQEHLHAPESQGVEHLVRPVVSALIAPRPAGEDRSRHLVVEGLCALLARQERRLEPLNRPKCRVGGRQFAVGEIHLRVGGAQDREGYDGGCEQGLHHHGE